MPFKNRQDMQDWLEKNGPLDNDAIRRFVGEGEVCPQEEGREDELVRALEARAVDANPRAAAKLHEIAGYVRLMIRRTEHERRPGYKPGELRTPIERGHIRDFENALERRLVEDDFRYLHVGDTELRPWGRLLDEWNQKAHSRDGRPKT